MKSLSKFWVLEGYGIECEKETHRFLATLGSAREIRSLFLPKFLANPTALREISEGDCLFFPGGFSFSDHFGSGTLLSFELRRAKIIDALLERSCHLIGVCNGFQILTALGLFGGETQLKHNQVAGRDLGFINRWVQLRYELDDAAENFRFPVRHGEGRLEVAGKNYWSDHGVRPLLRYEDADFDNGSFERVAGLLRRIDRSWIIGMMPHPEIAVRATQDPTRFAGEGMPAQRNSEFERAGDGQRFFQKLFQNLEISL